MIAPALPLWGPKLLCLVNYLYIWAQLSQTLSSLWSSGNQCNLQLLCLSNRLWMVHECVHLGNSWSIFTSLHSLNYSWNKHSLQANSMVGRVPTCLPLFLGVPIISFGSFSCLLLCKLCNCHFYDIWKAQLISLRKHVVVACYYGFVLQILLLLVWIYILNSLVFLSQVFFPSPSTEHRKAIPQEGQGSFSCHFSSASSFVIQSGGLWCTLWRTQDNNKIADNAKDSF